ncbi:MAG: hypothetical protein ACOYLS_01255 [Polymorphobacter sp.]
MSATHHLIAYLATLLALVIVFTVAIVAGALNGAVLGKVEVFGLGTIAGGLIGVLRLPSMRSGPVTGNTETTTILTEGEKQ